MANWIHIGDLRALGGRAEDDAELAEAAGRDRSGPSTKSVEDGELSPVRSISGDGRQGDRRRSLFPKVTVAGDRVLILLVAEVELERGHADLDREANAVDLHEARSPVASSVKVRKVLRLPWARSAWS